MKGQFIGMAIYFGQLIPHRSYKILPNDSNPTSVVISRDVNFVEDEFDISNLLRIREVNITAATPTSIMGATGSRRATPMMTHPMGTPWFSHWANPMASCPTRIFQVETETEASPRDRQGLEQKLNGRR
jgi:hypothetical protein